MADKKIVYAPAIALRSPASLAKAVISSLGPEDALRATLINRPGLQMVQVTPAYAVGEIILAAEVGR
jgi:hypothetical protein